MGHTGLVGKEDQMQGSEREGLVAATDCADCISRPPICRPLKSPDGNWDARMRSPSGPKMGQSSDRMTGEENARRAALGQSLNHVALYTYVFMLP